MTELIHPSLLTAHAMLIDPEQSVTLPIVPGKTPGELAISHCLMPPRNVHRQMVANQFTVELGYRVFTTLSVMTSLVQCDPGIYTILGFHEHDSTYNMLKAIPEPEQREFSAGVTGLKTDRLFVGAKFSTVTREGSVFVSKEFFSIICRIHRDELQEAQERQERIGRAALRLR